MSLTAALRSSLSGLSLAQLGLSVTSNNISNVNTPGYTRKIVEQVSQARSGIGSGVDLGAITRRVNNSLLGEMRTQNSTSYRSQTTSEYFTRLQDLFGRPGATSSLNNQILSLANAFEALGAGPENPQNQINTVTEAVNLTQKINNLGQTIQNLRGETDQEIVTMVGEINALLNHIHDLNHQIVGTPENSQSFADLEDQRDQALQDLSQYIDVSYFTQADGQFVVLTGASMPLVSNGVFQLAYTPQSAVVPGSTFNAITINGSNDLTNIVQNGKL
ncbi:MAG: flagellar hook-associated protein FlgK, partial [Dongiaceae bacterium]